MLGGSFSYSKVEKMVNSRAGLLTPFKRVRKRRVRAPPFFEKTPPNQQLALAWKKRELKNIKEEENLLFLHLYCFPFETIAREREREIWLLIRRLLK